jgi:hypothetical protein
MRCVVVEEQAGDEFASRAGAGFVEDRLQVVLDGVGGEWSRRPISLPFSARLGGGRMALRTS